MKKFISLCIMFAVLSAFSQLRLQPPNDTTPTKYKMEHDYEAFQPHIKLLNTSIWNRVTANRFECDFLRLAVEWRNHQYWLLEMDGQQRLLARHEQYAVIAHVIVHLTLRRTPNWLEYEQLRDNESHDDHYLKLVLLHYARYHFGWYRFSF